MTKTQNSGSAAGAASATHIFGVGRFLVNFLSVSAGLTTDRLQSIRVQLRKELADGTFKDVFVGSGYFSPNAPFVIRDIELEGPALLVSFAFHVDTTSHNVDISYRRVSEFGV